MASSLLDLPGQDGGYILAPTHGVTGDMPVYNVPALVEEAREREWA